MSVSLEMIAEALKKYNPEVHLSMKDYFIETAIMLNHPQPSFEPEILYIGKASDLEKIPTRRSPINLLCVYDSPIQQEYNECFWLNLITVCNQVNVACLYKEVKDLLIARRQNIQASVKFFDSLVSGHGLQKIVDTGSEILGNPLIVNDAASRYLAYTKNMVVNNSIWQELINSDFISHEGMKPALILEQMKIITESAVPVISTHYVGRRYLLSRITVNNRSIGSVGMMEYEKPIEEKDAEILQFFCRVVSCEMQKESFFSYTQGATYEFLIADLLEGKISNPTIVHERMSALALDLKENLYILTVRDAKDIPGNPALPYLEIPYWEIRLVKANQFFTRTILSCSLTAKRTSP